MFRRGPQAQLGEEQLLLQELNSNYEKIKLYFLTPMDQELSCLAQFDQYHLIAQFHFYWKDYEKSLYEISDAKRKATSKQDLERLFFVKEEKKKLYEESLNKVLKYILPRMYLKLVNYAYPEMDLYLALVKFNTELESDLDNAIQFPQPYFQSKIQQSFNSYHQVWMKCNAQKNKEQNLKKRKAETLLEDAVNKRLKATNDIAYPSSIGLPFKQRWLLERMKALGYKVNMKGICYGIAGSAMQAGLVGKSDVYYKRLQHISQIQADKLKQYIEAVRIKKLAILNKAKHHGTDTIEKTNDLAEQDKVGLEILNFFDTLVIYHKAKNYSYLYPIENRPKNQNLLRSAEIVQSIEIEKQGGLVEVDRFYGAYQLADLTYYFNDLITLIHESKLNIPFGLMLGSLKHMISVTFVPDPNGLKILLMNPGVSELYNSQYHFTAEQLADYVLRGFSLNANAIFSTHIFCTKDHEDVLLSFNKQWKMKRFALHEFLEKNTTCVDSNNASLLHIAAREGDCDLLQKIINSGVDVNIKTSSGFTALFIAAQNGRIKAFDLLLMKGANTTINGSSILHEICSISAVECIEPLLKYGLDVNRQDNEGNTPLMVACHVFDLLIPELFAEQFDLINELLKNGALIDLPNNEGNTPLFDVCVNSNFELVDMLLKNGASVSVQNREGNTPLLHLCKNGNDNSKSEQMIIRLLSAGADVNAQNNKAYTALHFACKNGHYEMTRCLLENNTYPNPFAQNGLTPLHMAILEEESEITELLLAHGADATYSLECSIYQFKKMAEKFQFHPTFTASIMQKFTNEQEIIRVTPQELAYLTGNSEIISLVENQTKREHVQDIAKFSKM